MLRCTSAAASRRGREMRLERTSVVSGARVAAVMEAGLAYCLGVAATLARACFGGGHSEHWGGDGRERQANVAQIGPLVELFHASLQHAERLSRAFPVITSAFIGVAVRGDSGRAFETPMVAKMAKVLAMCSRCLTAEPGGGAGASAGNQGSAANAAPCGRSAYKRKRTKPVRSASRCCQQRRTATSKSADFAVRPPLPHRVRPGPEWLAKVPSCPLCKQSAVDPGRLVPTPCRSRRGPS
ncbi:unnamed protein product [Prorocentrum cordatum]|uniref:Uncharacterized protein n=1 Tax=Prorocentrum cordatum TaxID=2364126 RepID=A0ABN9VA84_9DINO|nr:unnamed protein product [Polarella glacialis]